MELDVEIEAHEET